MHREGPSPSLLAVITRRHHLRRVNDLAAAITSAMNTTTTANFTIPISAPNTHPTTVMAPMTASRATINQIQIGSVGRSSSSSTISSVRGEVSELG